MTDILREHFNKFGYPKKSYCNKGEAENYARKIHQRAYKCSFCNNYHLTKTRRLSDNS